MRMYYRRMTRKTADIVQEMTRDCGCTTGDDQGLRTLLQEMTRDCQILQEMTRDCSMYYRR
ncbi:unnamed protein product [Staurois parvus]|uniref:Uncharacterized protein n=1 Tax=Staurois parvus TaxID=386267 RepID=A0ABN9EYU4_9NEOB|nr:unnamed protein product [Staurois parvus]